MTMVNEIQAEQIKVEFETCKHMKKFNAKCNTLVDEKTKMVAENEVLGQL